MLLERQPARQTTLKVVRARPEHRDQARAMADCLSAAFSSGIWEQTPMPVGSRDDPAGALGVLHNLGPQPIAVCAKQADPDTAPDRINGGVVGCVVGGIMDQRVIDGYQLAEYGAQPGDGLLAFIGIVPQAQGRRYLPIAPDLLTSNFSNARSPSLARHLFTSWLKSPVLEACPRLYIRTRRRIGPIRYLCDQLAFEFCGDFKTVFRGQPQTRLVYRRNNQPRDVASR